MAKAYMARAASQDRSGGSRPGSRSSSQERFSDKERSSDASHDRDRSPDDNRSPESPRKVSINIFPTNQNGDMRNKELDAPPKTKPTKLTINENLVTRTASMQLVDQLADLEKVIDSMPGTNVDDGLEDTSLGEERPDDHVVEGPVIDAEEIILEEDDLEVAEHDDKELVLPFRTSSPPNAKETDKVCFSTVFKE